jgi:hypothetical protein
VRSWRARALALALLAGGIAGAAHARSAPAQQPTGRPRPAEQSLARLEDEYLDGLLAARPDLATRFGLHDREGRLEPVTQASLDAERARLGALEQRLAAIPRAGLSSFWAAERDLLTAKVAAERVELEVVRRWERDPSAYLDLARGAIEALLERGAGSPCARAHALARRLARVPDVLRAARVNLSDPPRALVEEALPGYRLLLCFYRTELPRIATECRDARTQADLAQADTSAVRAVGEFLDYLETDLLPRAGGAPALGVEGTRRALAADWADSAAGAEPEALIERGRRELAWIEARLDTLGPGSPGGAEATAAAPPAVAAREPGPAGSGGARDSAAADSVRAMAATAATDSLTAVFERALGRIRIFLASHALVDLPLEERVRARVAPPCSGPGTVGLDAPGPWEPTATQAWLDVAAPESLSVPSPSVAPDTVAAEVSALREVFPGRYLQALAWRRVPPRLRQVLAPVTTTEGWAGYAAGLMIEQGHGGHDPRLERAALEAARCDVANCVAVLSLHTGRMSLDEVTAFLESAGGLPPAAAAHAARRAAAGPGGAAPALGRWRILDLREELRARLGAHFDLRAFHDALLRQGSVPLFLARAALLEETRADAGSLPR